MFVTFKGQRVAVGGEREIEVGDTAPEAVVVTQTLEELTVGGAKAQPQVLITVPSLDTSVCATETRKFNEKLAGMTGVDAVVISMDLPFAAKRFCTTEGIDLTVASDYRNRDFGRKYGVILQEGPLKGLLARTIFVVNPEGKVVYRQVVPEITEEPDYEEVLQVLRDL